MKHFNYKSRQKPAFHKILVISVAFLLLAVPAHASNEVGPYFTFTGSMDMFEDMTLVNKDSSTVPSAGDSLETETELGFTHSIGYQFRNSLSAELEFSYKSADFGAANSDSDESKIDGDINTKSLLLNGIYYFDIREFYTPYIGYGIGIAVHEATLDGFDEGEDTTFAHQFKMGVDMEFNRKVSWLLGYRYSATSDPKLGFFDGEITTHSIEGGVKFHF